LACRLKIAACNPGRPTAGMRELAVVSRRN
jgi:hypothetical protein